jgi:hypothetical protein
MTFTDFIPPKTWAFIVKIADENNLSTKEVQRIFLNKICHDMGMTCNHERIGLAKSDKEPYCKDCWTRLRKQIRESYRIGTKLIKGEFQYLEKESFLDDFYRDREIEIEKAKKEAANKKRTGRPKDEWNNVLEDKSENTEKESA